LAENHYHHGYEWSRLDQMAHVLKRPRLREEAQELVELGLAGKLTPDDVHRLLPYNINSLYLRDAYTSLVSWALYTTEYLDSLERLLRGKRVLEVCAGTGVLGRHMRQRGMDWRSTDTTPANEDVEQCEALLAVSLYKPDVIFASWIPYESALDQRLAELGIPMVLVGESHGGCTGSEEFWERGGQGYDPQNSKRREWDTHYMQVLFDWFSDVSQFSGIHDVTSLVLPAGTTFIVEDKGVFGPPV
jgi:hypothetical protein